MQDGRSAVNEAASLVKESCIHIALNGHMLRCLASTDGAGGDPARRAFTRFDVVSIGEWWGGDYEGGRFQGKERRPLGIAFELAAGDSALDRAPPLVHMDRPEVHRRYFKAEDP